MDYQENVTAVEGEEEAAAYLSVQVEGNPVPQFRFYKGVSEVYEGGRYQVITDGETNTVCFCIRKAKSVDEGKYKVVAYNKHGEDSVTMSLFVSGEQRGTSHPLPCAGNTQNGAWTKMTPTGNSSSGRRRSSSLPPASR